MKEIDSGLGEIKKFVDSIDPLSGPNLLRHSPFKDNGDGTMTLRRHVPFGSASDYLAEKRVPVPEMVFDVNGMHVEPTQLYEDTTPKKATLAAEDAHEARKFAAYKILGMTCQHCKYWQEEVEGNPYQCKNDKVTALVDDCGCGPVFKPSADFGCTKFEAKV